MTPSHSNFSSNLWCFFMKLLELKGSLVLIAKSGMEFTYIRTNVTSLSLVELETFRAMTLVLVWVNANIFSRTSVAISGIVEPSDTPVHSRTESISD